ncbi:pirin family protein [Bacteriovoracaceae bacterium]|nr:pirin family protein [Bacteriovoracaceae bacterium]
MKSKNKVIKYVFRSEEKHWVGDGFHVHGLLRPSEEINKSISPFILMDYASPKEFSKTNTPKGVGQHPHRGFETVTFAYQGEIEHRDSSGGGGVIKSGDVQWMTAGKGVIHDEFHSKEFSKSGGIFEMVQLWVNLPAKDKMSDPKYQEIQNKDIPNVELSDKSNMRIIAGEYVSTKGPSSTFTPINIFDISSSSADNLSLNLEEGTNTILLILKGEIKIDNNEFKEQSVIIYEQDGEKINFTTSSDFKALLLNGEPINEPIVAHGPFVMNTKEEINQAIIDYQNGKMGTL